MNNIKLLITDIDGTVLNEKCEYTPKLKNLFHILTNNGVKVVLATGRMFMGQTLLGKNLNLKLPLFAIKGQ